MKSKGMQNNKPIMEVSFDERFRAIGFDEATHAAALAELEKAGFIEKIGANNECHLKFIPAHMQQDFSKIMKAANDTSGLPESLLWSQAYRSATIEMKAVISSMSRRVGRDGLVQYGVAEAMEEFGFLEVTAVCVFDELVRIGLIAPMENQQ